MAWQFLVTDLSGAPLGEASNASARSVTLPHQRVPLASFSIPMWDPLADILLTNDCLLRCYRTDPTFGSKQLAFHGPVISTEEAADGTNNSMAVSAAGALWRLAKRIIPASIQATGAVYGTDASPIDLGLAAHTMLADVNGPSFTGIDVGTRIATSTGVINLGNLKDAATGLGELHAGLNSFEFEIQPTEPTASGGAGGWPRIGLMNIKPIIGVTRDDAVFEFGTPRANIASYSRSISRENIMNQGIISVAGWPNGAGGKVPIQRGDATSMANRGRFEDIIPDSSIVDDTIRTSVADFYVKYRKDPRQIIAFRLAVNATPSPLTDFFVGDTVRARATVNNVVRFDGLFRVWGMTFTIDDNGNETTELELVTPS